MNRRYSPADLSAATDSTHGDYLTYVQTRLRSRAARLLTSEDYDELLEADLDQIALRLDESGFESGAGLGGPGVSRGDVVRGMLQRKLEREAQSLKGLLVACPPAGAWAAAYGWKYDLTRIRAALRARRAQADLTDGFLSPLANVPFAVYEQLLAARGDDVPAALGRSPFGETVRRAMANPSLPADEIEAGLVRDCGVCFLKMVSLLAPNDPGRALLVGETHLLNVYTVLSARLIGAPAEESLAQLIPYRGWTEEDDVRELLAADEGVEMLSILQAATRHRWMEASGGKPLPIEAVVRRQLLRAARRTLASGLASPASIPAYLFLAETEARNLWAVVSARESGIEPESVRERLAA